MATKEGFFQRRMRLRDESEGNWLAAAYAAKQVPGSAHWRDVVNALHRETALYLACVTIAREEA
jgi:hypothetical protein